MKDEPQTIAKTWKMGPNYCYINMKDGPQVLLKHEMWAQLLLQNMKDGLGYKHERYDGNYW